MQEMNGKGKVEEKEGRVEEKEGYGGLVGVEIGVMMGRGELEV